MPQKLLPAKFCDLLSHINMSLEPSPRLRIAPSPTGVLHVGTARTALFNWLFARHHGGKFVLRIEDTDVGRSNPQFEKDIIEGLAWLDILGDEGPNQGGPYGPYRQSERIPLYKTYLEKLLQEGKAFYCFHTEKELEEEKIEQMNKKMALRHICSYRNEIGESQDRLRPSVIRLKKSAGEIQFHDLIRGTITFQAETVGDVAVAKNLETPLYNLAVVVDDYEMKITHVIRGEDHISNTPKQLMIARAFEISPPLYAHLPLLLGEDRSKLSKRHGAVGVLEYQAQGYLPEAMVNFLALLGWHPRSDQELFNRQELIEAFSLDRVQPSGAVVDIKKLNWLNHEHLKRLSKEDFFHACIPFLEKAGLVKTKGEIWESPQGVIERLFIEKALEIARERMQTLQNAPSLTDFFFLRPEKVPADLLIWKDMTLEELKKSLDVSLKTLSGIEMTEWDKKILEMELLTKAEAFGNELRHKSDKGYLLWPLRVALSGKKASPGPVEIIEALGKEESLRRVKNALEKL